MAQIKTDEVHLEHWIKIKQGRFNELLIKRATWFHLDGPSKIQWLRRNCNDSHWCIH